MTANEPHKHTDASARSGWHVQPEPSPEAAPVEQVEPESPVGDGALGNGAVVLLGVFGGLYLLYTWGWFEVARSYAAINAAAAADSGTLGGVLQQIVFWIAPLAPAAWFFTSRKITRERGMGAMAIALLIGAIVLVPLPLVIGGAL